MTKTWAICKCFQQNNIFLREYGAHVSFLGRDQFVGEYGPYLKEMGCDNIDNVVREVEEEVQRRVNLHESSWKRKCHIRENYKFKHPQIQNLSTTFLEDIFLDITKDSINGRVNSNVQKLLDNVYSFPVFTKDFCKSFVEEMRNFKQSSLPRAQPNSMNKHGVLMFELGLDALVDNLRTDYL